jgi:hypothetical protein
MGTARKIDSYIRARMMEMARPETRAVAEPLAAWALRRIRLDGKPFSFEGHEFLRAIYDDRAPHIVLSKAAQIGGTTAAILRAIHTCIIGLDVIYFFPTRSDVLDFSRARVNPLVAENAFLAKLMTDTDTMGVKKIGDAHLYFRGMQSSVGMKSVPADLIVFDELDEAEPQAKAMARERLGHSDYKRIVELSNPSLPDYGIDEIYQRSDQRHWTVRCAACNTWTALDQEFPRKLGQDVRIIRPRKGGGFYRACPKCEAALDMAQGEWVPELPSRSIHGYRISQLISSKVDPGEILEEYRTTRYPDRFFNLKIGIPWADLERRVDAATVLALCGDEPVLESNAAECSMGVDTGKALHVVILQDVEPYDGRQRLVHLCECHDFAELDALMKRFHVDLCVIDSLPETHATREFANAHHGVVYMSQFVESQRGEPRWDSDTHMVAVNRTDALDASRAALRQGRVILPRRQPIMEEFATHISADAKVLDEDEETGIKKYRYVKTGTNHYSFAFTYAWMAASGNPGARGWIRYAASEMRKRNAAEAEPAVLRDCNWQRIV